MGYPFMRLHTGPLKIIFILPLFCLPLLLSFSCRKQQEAPPPPEKVTIAYMASVNSILVDIAFAKGYFAQEGLDARPQPFAYGKLALDSVLAGKADLATAADTPIMLAVMNGKQITTVGVIQTSNRDEAIVARKDRGIASPADLKGKRIGVTAGTATDFFLHAFLADHDIDLKDVTIVNMTADNEMSEALVTGRVDAVSAFTSIMTVMKKELGSKGAFFFDESIYTEKFCVAAMQEYVRVHPEIIKKFLRALIRAETLARQDPEEAKRVVADFLHMDKAAIDEIWPIFTIGVKLDQALLADLEDQSRWALKKGLTINKDIPNFLDFISPDGLLAVKPEAVTILR